MDFLISVVKLALEFAVLVQRPIHRKLACELTLIKMFFLKKLTLASDELATPLNSLLFGNIVVTTR